MHADFDLTLRVRGLLLEDPIIPNIQYGGRRGFRSVLRKFLGVPFSGEYS